MTSSSGEPTLPSATAMASTHEKSDLVADAMPSRSSVPRPRCHSARIRPCRATTARYGRSPASDSSHSRADSSPAGSMPASAASAHCHSLPGKTPSIGLPHLTAAGSAVGVLRWASGSSGSFLGRAITWMRLSSVRYLLTTSMTSSRV